MDKRGGWIRPKTVSSDNYSSAMVEGRLGNSGSIPKMGKFGRRINAGNVAGWAIGTTPVQARPPTPASLMISVGDAMKRAIGLRIVSSTQKENQSSRQ